MHHHTFKTINQNQEGLKEICIVCKFKLISKKDPKTGRIDNKKYLKYHQKDTAQPFGRTSKVFKKYYPGESGYISRFKK